MADFLVRRWDSRDDSQCAVRCCNRDCCVALVAKASRENKAVVAKEGSQCATALASKIGANVSKLPSGPSRDGGAGQPSGSAVPEPKTESGQSETVIKGRVRLPLPGLPLFRHYERDRARLGGLWKNG